MLLYRPIGLNELRLIYDAGMRAFPPRLPDQSVFYPVLNAEYAEQIARDWNTKQAPFAGYVTRFALQDAYAARFEPRQVGGGRHVELWVPAEELPEFNAHLESAIAADAGYFGVAYTGEVPRQGLLAGRQAVQQLRVLSDALAYGPMDFACEIGVNHRAVFLNFALWLGRPADQLGVPEARRREVVQAVRAWWAQRGAGIDLPSRGEYVA